MNVEYLIKNNTGILRNRDTLRICNPFSADEDIFEYLKKLTVQLDCICMISIEVKVMEKYQ